MRKKINCKVVQSRRLDISNAAGDVRRARSSASVQASGDTHTARPVSAYHAHLGSETSHVDAYA